MDTPNTSSGSKAAGISRAEITTLLLVFLGAITSVADMLPPKYQGLILALWCAVRVYLRLTGQSAVVAQAEEFGGELKDAKQIATAKRAEPVK